MTTTYLVFDHFFWQDLDELEHHLEAGEQVVRIPYQRWHRLARRHFPASAFDGLQQAFAPELENAWQHYRQHVEREVRWMLAAYRPSLFVVPSDAFFYIRPFIESFRRHGVRTFVLQKETTISPMVMDEHSRQVGTWVPFMSDFMTVCSERHKQFWVRSGVEPDLIEVTGQPRFDVYARPAPSEHRAKPRLLYLSYDDGAYLPSDVGVAFDGSWRELRQATERCLAEVSDRWDITVKVHPQQPAGDD